jgi:hypothetical protein
VVPDLARHLVGWCPILGSHLVGGDAGFSPAAWMLSGRTAVDSEARREHPDMDYPDMKKRATFP